MVMFFIRVARRRAEQPALPVPTAGYMESVDYGPVIEWLEVGFRIFSLSIFSGIFYLFITVLRQVLAVYR
jgi:hypothetical protein